MATQNINTNPINAAAAAPAIRTSQSIPSGIANFLTNRRLVRRLRPAITFFTDLLAVGLACVQSALFLHRSPAPGSAALAALPAMLLAACLLGLCGAYRTGDVGAAIASGSFPTLGMIVAPCSVRTMSEIATGVTASLLTRAADVTLKERRRLVLMVRETPLHLGHLRTMVALTEMGAVIAPPVPAFYAHPASLEEMIDQSVGRALDLFGLAWSQVRRWGWDAPEVSEEAD